ncbi:uncharacterized protein [Brachionichthys hirsutus]|uniref:uncharacterized protein n=1 Tax=Brachionichthys hirsutus TaxID=412623 RepID=UPI003604F808
MAVGFSLGVALLLSVCLNVKGACMPDGVVHMECLDRYFTIAIDLSFVGGEPHFEAVDETGVYPITEQYGARCGYSVGVLPLQGIVELRASYFSCHTGNKDEVFTFNFKLVVMEEEANYTLNGTCSPAFPWSAREVTCEADYMEVSVTTEVTCPSGTKTDNWNVLKVAHGSTTSDWQVIFQKGEEQLPPMTLSDAWNRGYMFELTDKRLVFRTPYGQPDSSSIDVKGVPVELVHATLFSRQSWVVLMVDLVAACSMYVGSCNDTGSMVWETPDRLYPSLHGPQLNIGLNGKLMGQSAAEAGGYIVEKHNGKVRIKIPYSAEGRYRKSVVAGGLYEIYVFHLHVEQILRNQDQFETRVRFHRTLASPLLQYPLFTENRTVLQDRVFTVYLGDVPEDVVLTAVNLNGQEFTLLTDGSSHNVTELSNPNATHSYTLEVPFDDPVVLQKFSKEDWTLRYTLDINYTLTVLPENERYFHPALIVAMFTDVSPPAFEAICSESGVSFRLDHRPFDYVWEIGIGEDPLTSELAAQLGYVMSNDSETLLLDVPLFSHGFKYTNITLKSFLGTFEILVRDRETSAVQGSSVRTCPFTRTELIMCSPDGRMTVVADLPLSVPSATAHVKIHLADERCRPKEADGARVLFSFPLNSCGSTVKLGLGYVTYQNEISYHAFLKTNESVTERVGVRCTYQLAALHRLFKLFRFEADSQVIGRFIRRTRLEPALQSPTNEPTAVAKRTLHHPSFLPLYIAADLGHHRRYRNTQTVYPLTPDEMFYSDPVMGSGRRVLNTVRDLKVDSFQLNTPPPVMSARVAPPARPDPFRSGTHPTRNLGSPTLKTTPLQPGAPLILQLTQEEDQAITNLLTLHHQGGDGLVPERVDSNPVPLLGSSLDSSDEEARFRETDGTDALRAPLAADGDRNDDCAWRRTAGGPASASSPSEERSRWRKRLDSEAEGRLLSGSEEDAVFVLLNL